MNSDRPAEPRFRVGLRITTKLALAMTLGIGVVVIAVLLMRIQREVELFDVEMRKDHAALAHALALSASTLAARAAAAQALELIDDANTERDEVDIRWVEGSGAVDQQIRTEVVSGPSAAGTLVTTVGLVLDAQHAGVIELREPRERAQHYVRETVVRALGLGATLIALCAGIIYGTGRWLLGRPMGLLVDKLHRVGQGDLAGAVVLGGRDEMAMIADEVNAMCASLAASQAKVEHEMRARIAALEQLRHVDRLRTVGLLASGIAHELGTPLNVVAARAKMISSGQSADEETREDATVIGEQAVRMTAIIRQLLDFARATSSPKLDTELHAIADSALRMLGPLASKSGVELVVLDDVPGIRAHVAATQVEQALTNLVINGIHAQRQGGQIRVRLAESDQPPPPDVSALRGRHPTIAVEDDGTGMDDKTRERVFEPFFTTKEVGAGTGLGLSVAYGIVREHGGWIEVQSEPDRGSSFTMHLPPVDDAASG